MPVIITDASAADAGELFELRRAIAEDQTRRFGRGRWSSFGTERGIARGIATSRVMVARNDGTLVGSLRLDARKPWAIDLRPFTPADKALYLHDMMVRPEVQGEGIGRMLMEKAADEARRAGAGAIRLDAYDAAAGAGRFYRRCGFAEVGRSVYRRTPLIYFELLL